MRRARAGARRRARSERLAARRVAPLRGARALLHARRSTLGSARSRDWPAGRRCPLGRLREAWVAHRYGLAKVVDAGGALAGAGAPDLASAWDERSRSTRRSRSAARRAGRRAARRRCARSPAQRRADGSPATSLACSCWPRACAPRRCSTTTGAAGARPSSCAALAARRSPGAARLPAPRRRGSRRRRRAAGASATRCCSLGRDPAAWPNAELALARCRSRSWRCSTRPLRGARRHRRPRRALPRRTGPRSMVDSPGFAES